MFERVEHTCMAYESSQHSRSYIYRGSPFHTQDSDTLYIRKARRPLSSTIHAWRVVLCSTSETASSLANIRTDDLVLARQMEGTGSPGIHQVKLSQQHERGSDPKRTARVNRLINATLEAVLLGHNEGWQSNGDAQQVRYCMIRATCASLQLQA